MTLKIILAEDHQLVREGIRSILQVQPDVKIIGETGDGLLAVQMVEQMRPDILICDLMMPGLNGLEVARQVMGKTKVIVLSMHADEPYVLQALRNGAYAYVLKESTTTDLIQAIHAVANGRKYLSPPFSDHAIMAYLEKAQTGQDDPYDALTTREREVLQLTAEGLPASEISTRLLISPRTVEIHRANFMRKLDLHTQSEIIRYAIKRGIISLDQ